MFPQASNVCVDWQGERATGGGRGEGLAVKKRQRDREKGGGRGRETPRETERDREGQRNGAEIFRKKYFSEKQNSAPVLCLSIL
jgi:hypothetical protein